MGILIPDSPPIDFYHSFFTSIQQTFHNAKHAKHRETQNMFAEYQMASSSHYESKLS